jgi:hypothetical protein
MGLPDSVWANALTDAGLSEDDVMLFQLAGGPVGGAAEASAVVVTPGVSAESVPRFPLSSEQLALLNGVENLQRFRVISFTAASEPIAFGYIRHELEHVRQYNEMSDVLSYGNLVAAAMIKASPALPGSGRLYNLLPREVDANAAAADAIRAHYPDAVESIKLSVHSALVRGHGPTNPKTLFFRTFCFSFLFASDVEEVFASHGLPLQQYLCERDPLFPDAWRTLASDASLSAQLYKARTTYPDAQAVRRASMPGDAWTNATIAYELAYKTALVLLGYET